MVCITLICCKAKFFTFLEICFFPSSQHPPSLPHFPPPIFIALYLGLVVGEKHVYRKKWPIHQTPIHHSLNSIQVHSFICINIRTRMWILRDGTDTNRQCFADICKSRQSRFGSKSRIYCRIDARKIINIAQRHLENKHRQLILPICTRFIANFTLQTLADIGKALPISLCAAPKRTKIAQGISPIFDE